MDLNVLLASLADRPRAGVSFDLRPLALERWNSTLQAAADDEENTISILDPIGYDYWTGEGVTAKRITGILRGMAGADVVVNINSPGGDMFEGLAIYNVLREYKGNVTVKVLGLAASAASIIAMAGDTIQVARSGFLMIHNCWAMAVGNRHDMREFADTLEPFDEAMADIYAERTGGDLGGMQKLMDAETWINGSAAVEQGFADALLSSDSVKESAKARNESQIAAHKLDVILAKQGMPRSERRALLQQIKSGTPSAAGPGTRHAAETPADLAEPIAELQAALARFSAAATR
ncbi:head maturation protease, ClpP-related [Pseudomonas kuykendallii]|uniref:head maturation protease, ClpP-related n=1 Tax=Pseudomonas kuykendallii TaxID=1007099 RepID=UPI0028D0902A|nr:head maturation protease, ClpP-related [Pseudomonas kuykendallii]